MWMVCAALVEVGADGEQGHDAGTVVVGALHARADGVGRLVDGAVEHGGIVACLQADVEVLVDEVVDVEASLEAHVHGVGHGGALQDEGCCVVVVKLFAGGVEVGVGAVGGAEGVRQEDADAQADLEQGADVVVGRRAEGAADVAAAHDVLIVVEVAIGMACDEGVVARQLAVEAGRPAVGEVVEVDIGAEGQARAARLEVDAQRGHEARGGGELVGFERATAILLEVGHPRTLHVTAGDVAARGTLPQGHVVVLRKGAAAKEQHDCDEKVLFHLMMLLFEVSIIVLVN